MANMDFYEAAGGDDAWRAWFDLCSVDRVREVNPQFAEGLANQIDSAMYSALRDDGISRDEMGDESPYLYFDSFFLLGSRRKAAKNRKPLKQHYLYRISLQDRPLKEFVCGTLFGSERGRVRDIARDWIATARGWRPHTITLENGKRQLVWEGAAADGDARETDQGQVNGACSPAAESLDREALRQAVNAMLEKVFLQTKVEKHTTALLLYVTAQSIAVDRPAVLEALGVEKSRAYQMKKKCLQLAGTFFREKGIATNDLFFAQELLDVCSGVIGDACLRTLPKD